MKVEKNKKILMIMYGAQIGGAEMQFIELANHLAGKHDVHLVSLGGRRALNAAYIDGRIYVNNYEYSGKISGIKAMMRAWIDNAAVNPDSIITTSYIGNTLGLLISFLKKTQLISLQTVSKCMWNPKADRLVLQFFDVLIAGASDIKDYLLEHGLPEDKVHVICNWVDFTKRDGGRNQNYEKIEKNPGAKAGVVIGCVGRLHRQKGQIYLIRAVAELLQAGKNVELKLVGKGDEYVPLKSEIARLGLSEKVALLGELTGDEYNDFFRSADIYVQPSLYEGLPRTLLDAMYYGKPIVASSVNGNREAITHGENGLLVPPEDVSELVRAITVLVDDDAIRTKLAFNAKVTVIERFDMARQMEKIEELLC